MCEAWRGETATEPPGKAGPASSGRAKGAVYTGERGLVGCRGAGSSELTGFS